MWKDIQCLDRKITISKNFFVECKFLVNQEYCSDFKSIYNVSLTSEQMHSAMEHYYNNRGKISEYNEILDYLGYIHMDPPIYKEQASKFMKFISKYKDEHKNKEIDLLTMRPTYIITDIPKDMYKNIIFIYENIKKVSPMLNLNVEFYFNNKKIYDIKTPIDKIDIKFYFKIE